LENRTQSFDSLRHRNRRGASRIPLIRDEKKRACDAFLSSLDHLLQASDDSYDRQGKDRLSVKITWDNNDNLFLWENDRDHITDDLLQEVDAATRNICGLTYWVEFNETYEHLAIHVF
jgi:hypothetical protein